MKSIPDQQLEELREALRRRGYLDRMILGDAGSRWAWLKGSVKAGLLAGLVLALAFLAMLVFLSSPPLATWGEILLLGFYLVVLCSLLTLAVEIVAGLLTRLLGRFLPGGARDRTWLAWGMGGLVAVGFALYLAAWWKGREDDAATLGVRLALVVFILLVSLAIGRLTSMTALLTLLGAGKSSGGRAAGAWKIQVLFVAVLLAVIWSALRRSELESRRLDPPADFATLPPAGRTLWIGVDGLGWSLMEALRAQGHLPRLDELARAGCRARLARFEAEPPAIWVSAATGFAPKRHGVSGIESTVLPGIGTPLAATPWNAPLLHAARALNPFLPPFREVPVSGVHRRDKMVWEILAQKSLPAFVVNWWATWPAVEGPGVRISERALFRLQAGGAADREVFPPEWMEDLERQYARIASPSSEFSAAERPADGPRSGPAMDRFHLELAGEAWREGRWPLVAAYLNGTDVLATGPSAPAPGRLGGLLRDRELVEHLEALDAAIGSLARAARPGDFVIVQGDPGRADLSGGGEAFLLVTGPGIAAAADASGSLLDVTPTLLAMQGFPVSEEMPGHPLTGCLAPAGSFPGAGLPTVPGFGPRRPPPGGASEFDPAVLEKLRSLGYIR